MVRRGGMVRRVDVVLSCLIQKEEMHMKKILVMLLSLMMVFGTYAAAQASGLIITDSADLLEGSSQFPFFAETDELAVNVRAEANAKTEKVARFERGQQLTVTAATVNDAGELWYAVALEDGTEGFVRSDLLIEAEEKTDAANEAQPGQDAQEYIGNKKSKKFHRPTCRSLPKESNRVYLSSREEAVDKGYDPCGNCKP